MRAPVMGSTAHVVVVGDTGLETWAIDRLRHLESLWSRFLPSSDVSRLNRARGRPVRVAPETAAVIDRAVSAWAASNGCFDPTIERCLAAAGYDRTFEEVKARCQAVDDPRPAAGAAPGCAGIRVSTDDTTVALPTGVTLDVGGIGKGFAADLVLSELLHRGADGACVNVGGDAAMDGDGPTADGWVVGVEDPFSAGRELTQLFLRRGAVATTSRLRRRWSCGDSEFHHVIDPRTGQSACNSTAAVTVIAGTATDAEVLTKVLFLDPDLGEKLLASLAASAMVISGDRRVRCVGDVAAFAA